jgi:N-acetylglucosamine-6-phosphate deacetylase
VIESALLSDDMYVEIIADGRHLPPELIRLILKVKGTDKVALITDSLSIAGTDVKHGWMLKTEYIIEDGVCKLVDRSAFAGSIATADMLIRVVSKEAGVPLLDTVKMMTKVPAEILGVNKGSLAAGLDADVVVFDDEINVSDIFVMGKKVK